MIPLCTYLCAGAGGRMEEAEESTDLQFRLPRYVKWRQHFELSCADVTMISLDFTQSEFKFSGRYGRYLYLFLCRLVHAPHGTSSNMDNQRRLRPADFPPKLLASRLCRTKLNQSKSCSSSSILPHPHNIHKLFHWHFDFELPNQLSHFACLRFQWQ